MKLPRRNGLIENKSTRWEEAFYSSSKLHGYFNKKKVNRATWLSCTQIMGISTVAFNKNKNGHMLTMAHDDGTNLFIPRGNYTVILILKR